MTPKPLTPEDHRAADMLAKGATQAAVAEELDTSATSIRRLLKRDDFKALVAEARSDRATDPAPDKTTPRSVLEEMLLLKNRDRTAPSTIAMQAAVALARLPDESLGSSEPTIERVLLTGDEPFDRKVAAILADTPTDESVYIFIAARDTGKQAAGAKLIGLTEGPWKPYEPVDPASPGDTPTSDEPVSGRRE